MLDVRGGHLGTFLPKNMAFKAFPSGRCLWPWPVTIRQPAMIGRALMGMQPAWGVAPPWRLLSGQKNLIMVLASLLSHQEQSISSSICNLFDTCLCFFWPALNFLTLKTFVYSSKMFKPFITTLDLKKQTDMLSK